MNDEKWQAVVGQIKDNFGVLRQETQELSEDDGPGSVEIVEFSGPVGKIRLERTTKPLLLDRKSIGSKRIGSDKVIQYTYSDTEMVNKLAVYKWNESKQSWDEITEPKSGSLFF